MGGAKPRKPFRPKTTCPDHAAHPSPNLLAKEAPPTAPGQQLVSDITDIPTREGWLYLIVMIALFSRFIPGWTLEETLEADLIDKALRRALKSGLVAPAAILHSDRASQSSARSTRELLERANLRQSMSAKGYCYDNAFAESAFASIKSEILADGELFASKAAARTAVFDSIETFYNRTRHHSSLGFTSPEDFLKTSFHHLNPPQR